MSIFNNADLEKVFEWLNAVKNGITVLHCFGLTEPSNLRECQKSFYHMCRFCSSRQNGWYLRRPVQGTTAWVWNRQGLHRTNYQVQRIYSVSGQVYLGPARRYLRYQTIIPGTETAHRRSMQRGGLREGYGNRQSAFQEWSESLCQMEPIEKSVAEAHNNSEGTENPSVFLYRRTGSTYSFCGRNESTHR